MPTKNEADALLMQCEWTWDSDKKGYVITGPNGKSIFLPANGYRQNTILYRAGLWGRYWGSQIMYVNFNANDYSCGSGFEFHTTSTGRQDQTTLGTDRYIGGGVRPVR